MIDIGMKPLDHMQVPTDLTDMHHQICGSKQQPRYIEPMRFDIFAFICLAIIIIGILLLITEMTFHDYSQIKLNAFRTFEDVYNSSLDI